MSDLKNPDGLRGPAPDGSNAAGIILPNSATKAGTQGTNLVLVQNTLYVARYSPLVRCIITKLSYDVQTLDVADPLTELVILDSLGNRRATTGSAIGRVNALGVQVVALQAPLLVARGDIIYAGIVTASAAVAALRGCSSTAGAGNTLLGTNMPEQLSGAIAAVAQPVAANVGTTLPNVANIPMLGVRVD